MLLRRKLLLSGILLCKKNNFNLYDNISQSSTRVTNSKSVDNVTTPRRDFSVVSLPSSCLTELKDQKFSGIFERFSDQILVSSRRAMSSSDSNEGGEGGGGGYGEGGECPPPPTPEQTQQYQQEQQQQEQQQPPHTAEDQLLEEVLMLTSTPIPIGTLFKGLSQESRQVLLRHKMPIETYLLRHKELFSVYKSNIKGMIMASRVNDVPAAAMKGVEASADQIFTGKPRDRNLHAVYTVLKYIPNEWSPYTSLGIPEEIRVKFMNKRPKAFFEAHPKYFEVKAQAHRAHTFEVRRSMALQQAQQQQVQQQMQQQVQQQLQQQQQINEQNPNPNNGRSTS